MTINFTFEDRKEYLIPFCRKKGYQNEYLYEIHGVFCRIASSRWRFYERSKECLVVVETDTSFVRRHDIDKKEILISKGGTYDLNILFVIDRNALLENEVYRFVNYRIKLLDRKSSKVIAEDTASLNLVLRDCCAECKAFYENELFQIKPFVKTLEYSDRNRGNWELHVADLHINRPSSNDFVFPQILSCRYEVQSGADIENKELPPIELDEFPKVVSLYVDMTNLSCPESDGELKLTVLCPDLQNLFCDDIAIEASASIPYRRAPEYNRLGVFFKDGDNELPIVCGKEYEIPQIDVLKAIGQIDDIIIRKNIVLRNLSSRAEGMVENAGVRIRDLKVGIVSSDLDRIEGMSEEEARREWAYTHESELVLNANGDYKIPVNFNLDKIGNIRIKNHKRELSWKLAISFKYWEDRYYYTQNDLGNPVVNLESLPQDINTWKSFQAVFSTCIHRTAPKCYYSVDLGTSAVVAYKMERNAINGFEVPSLIDLKTIKNNLLLAQYPDDVIKKIDNSEKRKDNSEEEHSIIASTLYLNSTSIRSNEFNFKNLLLWFSPSSGMTHPDYMYPCLKYMMGQRKVPRIPKLENPNFDSRSRDVEFVIQTVYEQLSKLYLNTSGTPLESLVLTVPNSFTPVHIEKIHNAVMDNVESLSEDMLEFVSESDAVLCSYITNTKDNDDLVRKRKEKDGEHILVYDMGAGTLDVTYAKCNIDDGTTIDIIGRIGLNKAGDYIDYLLGEILHELLSAKYSSGKNRILPEAFERVISVEPSRNTEYKDKKNLKDYLRNKVKRELKRSNARNSMPLADINGKSGYGLLGNYPSLTELENITIGDILENPKFLAYIKNCTEDVIAGLTNSYGKDMGLGKRRLIIDTIVLSGRTTSLEAIGEALRESITKHIPQNRSISYREVSGNTPLDQKTVVAKGALDYIRLKGDGIQIRKKMVYGSYGLILNPPQGDVWHLLMGEVYENPGRIELIIELNGAKEILLVHSYSISPLEDTNRMILHRLQIPPMWDGQSKKVIFHIENNMMMKYSISNIDGTNVTNYPLESHDDYYSPDLRKSLWPVIYN